MYASIPRLHERPDGPPAPDRSAAEGEAGHEIVFVYSARALNTGIHALDEVPLTEDDGSRHAAVWVAADRLDDPAQPCYPPGLVELLAKEPE
ncbi:MAG TPA: hypothetical protein VK943_13755 [Arenibaculum sp.]|nr:hypothetical protein [Arenibaculum sp.]